MKPLVLTLVGFVLTFFGVGGLLEGSPAMFLLVIGAPVWYFAGRELKARIYGRLLPDSSETTGHRRTVVGRFLANLWDLVVPILLPKTKVRKK